MSDWDPYAIAAGSYMLGGSPYGQSQPDYATLLQNLQGMFQQDLDKNGNPVIQDVQAQGKALSQYDNVLSTLMDQANTAMSGPGAYSPGALAPTQNYKPFDTTPLQMAQYYAQNAPDSFEGIVATRTLANDSPGMIVNRIMGMLNDPDSFNLDENQHTLLQQQVPMTQGAIGVPATIDQDALYKKIAQQADPIIQTRIGLAQPNVQMDEFGMPQTTTLEPSPMMKWYRERGLPLPDEQYGDEYLRQYDPDFTGYEQTQAEALSRYKAAQAAMEKFSGPTVGTPNPYIRRPAAPPPPGRGAATPQGGVARGLAAQRAAELAGQMTSPSGYGGVNTPSGVGMPAPSAAPPLPAPSTVGPEGIGGYNQAMQEAMHNYYADLNHYNQASGQIAGNDVLGGMLDLQPPTMPQPPFPTTGNQPQQPSADDRMRQIEIRNAVLGQSGGFGGLPPSPAGQAPQIGQQAAPGGPQAGPQYEGLAAEGPNPAATLGALGNLWGAIPGGVQKGLKIGYGLANPVAGGLMLANKMYQSGADVDQGVKAIASTRTQPSFMTYGPNGLPSYIQDELDKGPTRRQAGISQQNARRALGKANFDLYMAQIPMIAAQMQGRTPLGDVLAQRQGPLMQVGAINPNPFSLGRAQGGGDAFRGLYGASTLNNPFPTYKPPPRKKKKT